MKSLLLAIFSMTLLTANTQPYKTLKKYKPYKWMIGLSCTAIIDDGQALRGFADVENSWNYLYVPTSINFDKYLTRGWGIETMASYMYYKKGILINDFTDKEGHFGNFDVNMKFHLQFTYAPRMKWLDPFVSGGLGYTYRDAIEYNHIPNLNIGAGVNLFLLKNVGLQIRSSGKLGLYPKFGDTPSNYLHHSAGLIIRVQPPKNNSNDFYRRKHQWAFGNKRYNSKRGH